MSFDIRHGDCREVMARMDAESVDAIVSDPPYGLSFMGKGWDHGVPGVEFWTEALRVAKPGCHLLAFGGTRTFHRLAVAIEDAGWEIRDCVMWVYGCLSEDTEVLTPDGWERYNTARHKEVLAYDPEADVYQWERPSRWSEYRVESDTAYRIESDSTDQIVSRNHRCLVERGGKLAFVAAEECACVERVPYLQGDVSALPQSNRALLLASVLREGEALAEELQRERQGQETSWQGSGWTPESGMERGPDILQEEGQVRESGDQVRSLSAGICSDGEDGWVRHGASADCGDGDGASAVAERVRASCQPRRDGQSPRESDVVCIERGPQATRARTTYQTTVATVTPFAYTGLIFCPTVSTGAFVARRNGKVFVTGNSGFPKSHDVSKAIDKAAGAEREVVSRSKTKWTSTGRNERYGKLDYFETDGGYEIRETTAPATDAARQWQGWGTALKPAWEPVIVARKPLVGTVAENVQRHGTGAINVDGCRVAADWKSERPESWFNSGKSKSGDPTYGGNLAALTNSTVGDRLSELGRWPANVIHDGSAEVVGLFPVTASGALNRASITAQNGIYGKAPKQRTGEYAPDSGSAARFFYCAKASKADREEGCDALEQKDSLEDVGNKFTTVDYREGKTPDRMARNHHPTVKPTALMRYLCRLVTPPGGLVLDPFCGSGSTGKAAVLEGFRFIGIEREAEYVEIARARIAAAERSVPPMLKDAK